MSRGFEKVFPLWLNQLFKYSWVGIGSTLIHLTVASSSIYLFALNATLSNTLAFLIAMIFSYTMNTKWSFQRSVNLNNSQRFFIVSLFSYLVIILISRTFDKWQFPPIYSVGVIALIIPLIGFIAHKFWTFKT